MGQSIQKDYQYGEFIGTAKPNETRVLRHPSFGDKLFLIFMKKELILFGKVLRTAWRNIQITECLVQERK